jgi:hypothetical protein
MPRDDWTNYDRLDGFRLEGVSEQQQARLGPMLSQLEKLGATPKQISTFTPKEAYEFIRSRNMRMGDIAKQE